MAIPSDRMVERNPQVFAADAAEATVLMHADSSKYYGLDPIAKDLWARLEHPIPVSTLTADLIRAYEGDPVQISEDVQTVLADLISEGLVRETS